MFHDIFWGDPLRLLSLRSAPSFSSAPAMDWIETPTSYILHFNVPGFGKEDIKLQLEDGNILQIRGMAAKEEPPKDAEWRVAERGAKGEIERRVALPEDVKADQIKAQMENGVLTVLVPKETSPPKMKPRTIPVSSKL